MGRRFEGLDALRGFSALAVVFCHVVFFNPFPTPHWAQAFAGECTLAVPMFFGLSAFVMAYQYFGRLNTSSELGDFAVRRFFRLAPLFYAVCALGYLMRWQYAWPYPGPAAFWTTISFTYGLAYYFGINNIYDSTVSLGWSIGVEMIFYVLLPLVFLLVRGVRSALVFAIVCLVVGYLVDLRMPVGADDQLRRVTIISQAANFAFGLLAYFVYQTMKTIDLERRRRLSIYLFAAGGVIWLAAFATSDHFGGVPSSYIWRYFVSSAFPFFILGAALFDWPLLVNSITRRLGDWSYGIYLLQTFIIGKFIGLGFQQRIYDALPSTAALFVTLLAVAAGTIAMAAAAHYVIERPGIQLGRWIGRRTVERQPRAVPAE